MDFLGRFKPQVQIKSEIDAAVSSIDSALGGMGLNPSWRDQLNWTAQQIADYNSSMQAQAQIQNSNALAAQAQQSGWAATNMPHVNPIDDLTHHPFQAASLYVRLRMSREELKARDIEIAFVRQMGGCVHVAIVNQDRLLTMIDEEVGAFPSDAFIARIRLLL